MAARETDVKVATLISPTSGKVRMTDAKLATLLSPTSGKVRMTDVKFVTLSYRVPKRPRPFIFINT